VIEMRGDPGKRIIGLHIISVVINPELFGLMVEFCGWQSAGKLTFGDSAQVNGKISLCGKSSSTPDKLV